MKIYCAGPLFNPKEKEEMQEIADILEIEKFEVFLPHRDGLEFSNLINTFIQMGISSEKAIVVLNKAIFTLDVFQVLNSDGLILNMNGRVPDEGAMVEAGIAWNAGKAMVIYKNDVRTLLNGNDNPLLLGLSNFETVSEISEIPNKFNAIFADAPTHDKIDNTRIKNLYKKGEEVYKVATSNKDESVICRDLMDILEVCCV
ncbi:MAG TPA: nucleoside 2-deoxyribosyltransferase [Geobacteraceae bacterium]